jgi:DNA-binding NarL/FixJ family response regulator
MTRLGLSWFLSSYPDLVLTGEAGNSEEALAMCARDEPDVVLLDVQMPEAGGLSMIKRLRSEYPGVKVLILTSFGEPRLRERALREGAQGYLLKDISAYDLAWAIRAAKDGRQVGGVGSEPEEGSVRILGEGSEDVGERKERMERGEEYKLTRREREVLALIVEGKSNAEIAKWLGVSYNTVKFHVGMILSRLGVPTRGMAVTIAWQKGLVELERREEWRRSAS